MTRGKKQKGWYTVIKEDRTSEKFISLEEAEKYSKKHSKSVIHKSTLI